MSSIMERARAAGVKFAAELSGAVGITDPASHIHIASCKYIHGAKTPLQPKLAMQRNFKDAAYAEFQKLTGVDVRPK